MNKRIVITGSNGLLGQTLLKQLLETTHSVFAVSKGDDRFPIKKGYDYYTCDITNVAHFVPLLKEIQPHVIINTAAMTNVDVCEEKKQACDALNVGAVATMIEYCKEEEAHLIQISTDFIFDGKTGFYKETDFPNPLNYYGRSKLAAEQLILASKVKATILRTILVYGKVHKMNKSNIILWIKNALENKQPITIINDQFRMPTYVEELSKACLLVVKTNRTGVFNIASNTLLSIYEIAITVAKVFDLDKCYIKSISTKALNQKAIRPPKTGFDFTKTITKLGFEPKSFEEDLLDFKKQF